MNYFFLLFCLTTTLSYAQDCSSKRSLTSQEVEFQSHTIAQLQSLFQKQKFNRYILDEASDSYPPQVWPDVCADRKPTETFNLLGYYTYVLDPRVEENLAIINRVNSIDYIKGDAALDELRNFGNIIRVECEWGINTIPFTLKNLGGEIKMDRVGDAYIFYLHNSYQEDSKVKDSRFRTVIVKGNIDVVDEKELIAQGTLFKKTIRVLESQTHFTSRLNAFLVITGGREEIHRQLDTKQAIEELHQLIHY